MQPGGLKYADQDFNHVRNASSSTGQMPSINAGAGMKLDQAANCSLFAVPSLSLCQALLMTGNLCVQTYGMEQVIATSSVKPPMLPAA